MTTEPVDYEAMPGYWNAWVMQGETREARGERLEQVPERFRDGVRRHVQIAWAIRRRAAQAARTANSNHSNSTGGAS